MTTQASGAKITGILALTLQAQSALSIGDPVHIVGDYECDKADGTLPIVGSVSVRNVTRGSVLPPNANPNAGFYPVPNVPGDVTVEARGFAVQTVPVVGVALPGTICMVLNGTYVPAGTGGAAPYGIFLEGGTNTTVDVLVGPTA